MKKALLALGIMALCLLFVSCDKTTTEPAEPEPTAFEPFVDESGDLNVYIGDFIYPEE